jgi:hypothetical protein
VSCGLLVEHLEIWRYNMDAVGAAIVADMLSYNEIQRIRREVLRLCALMLDENPERRTVLQPYHDALLQVFMPEGGEEMSPSKKIWGDKSPNEESEREPFDGKTCPECGAPVETKPGDPQSYRHADRHDGSNCVTTIVNGFWRRS